GAGPPREDVADAVHPDVAAQLPRPAHEQVARLAVQVRERQAAHAAFRRRADARERHQRGPEPVAVDREVRRLAIVNRLRVKIVHRAHSLAPAGRSFSSVSTKAYSKGLALITSCSTPASRKYDTPRSRSANERLPPGPISSRRP